MMFQAIETRYLGPTNHRGSRVKAKCQAGEVTVHWDHALNVEGNHERAAQALRDKLGWVGEGYGEMIGGGLVGSGFCFVFTGVNDV